MAQGQQQPVGPDLMPAPPPGGVAPGGLSDDDLAFFGPALRGEAIAPVDQPSASGGAAGPAPTPVASPASAAPAPTSTAAPTAAPTDGAAPPAFSVPDLIERYNWAIKSPLGAQYIAPGIMQALTKMVPEGGFQLNADGSLALRPGAAQGAGQIAGAKAKAEQEQARITEQMKPQSYAPGTVVAPQGAGGAAAPVGTSPEVATALAGMRDKASIAQDGLSEAKMLQNVLNQIGTLGPGTESLGHIRAILDRAGFTDKELNTVGLPNASDVATAQKLSTDLVLNRAKTAFSRVTNRDLALVRASTPGADMPGPASAAVLGNVVIPEFWREARRFEDMSGLPAAAKGDAGAFNQAYAEWGRNNPIENFQMYPQRGVLPGTSPGSPGPAPGAVAPAPMAPGAPGSVAPAAPGGGGGPRRFRWDPTLGRGVPE